MRTTVEFEPDTAKAVERLRKERGIGTSEAVNELIRRGMLPPKERRRFEQRTRSLGIRVDVANVAEVLETLEGPAAR